MKLNRGYYYELNQIKLLRTNSRKYICFLSAGLLELNMNCYDFISAFLGAIWPFTLLGIIGIGLLIADLIAKFKSRKRVYRYDRQSNG